MPIINAAYIDTTPGACEHSPFAPPNGFSGTPDAYLELMRERFTDICHSQRMQAIALHYRNPEALPTQFAGPYQNEAWRIISSLSQPRTVITPNPVEDEAVEAEL